MENNKEEYLKMLEDISKIERTPDPEPSILFYSNKMKEGFENAMKNKANELDIKVSNDVDNTVHNDTSTKMDVAPPKTPNRRMRRLMWKQDEKFRKKYFKQLTLLEKYVEEHGLEALNKYLEDKNGNK